MLQSNKRLFFPDISSYLWSIKNHISPSLPLICATPRCCPTPLRMTLFGSLSPGYCDKASSKAARVSARKSHTQSALMVAVLRPRTKMWRSDLGWAILTKMVRIIGKFDFYLFKVWGSSTTIWGKCHRWYSPFIQDSYSQLSVEHEWL